MIYNILIIESMLNHREKYVKFWKQIKWINTFHLFSYLSYGDDKGYTPSFSVISISIWSFVKGFPNIELIGKFECFILKVSGLTNNT